LLAHTLDDVRHERNDLVQALGAHPLVLPALQNLEDGLPRLSLAIIQATLFLLAMIYGDTRVIPAILKRIAQWNSRELFLVAVMALGLGIGYATYLAGLSFAFGAFVAGMVLSESDYSHQALSDILPLRDVFGLLFANLDVVLLVVLLVAVGKALIFGLLTRAFGYTDQIPFAVGLGLFQIGEFTLPRSRRNLRNRSAAGTCAGVGSHHYMRCTFPKPGCAIIS
jgi:CPA2 family monovalent cation:H+ antiporter-2